MLSRKALVAKGALMTWLAQKMIAGATLDLDAILADVDDANFDLMKVELEDRLVCALRGKLKVDASVWDLEQLFNALSQVAEPEVASESVFTRPSVVH
jgi:hypothetical protein